MRARGFTLLELMTVVAIIGAMSALAAFSLQQTMVQGRVSAEIRRTMSRVQQARALSVSTGQCHGVMIGGAQSMTMAGAQPVRNRIVTFRKDVGANCDDFDPNNDDVLTRDWIGAEGNSADATRDDMMWDVLQGAPTDDLKIIFSGVDAAPRVMLGTTLQAPVMGPPQRYFFQLRSTRYDQSPGNSALNPTRRRLELTPTGNAMVALCPAGPNVQPCPL